MAQLPIHHLAKQQEDPEPTLPAPLTIIRTETVLSRLPIHNLSKKGRVHIHITQKNAEGEIELYWKVSPNLDLGAPRQLAYKLDTLIINRRIDELGRPLPKIIRLDSFKQIGKNLDVSEGGRTNGKVKHAFHENAGAYITAKLHYKAHDGTERTLEAGFTRYSVVFTGERLPDGTKADAVYLLLNEPYWEVLNSAPTRPLDYDYLKALPPAAQRCYEILSYKLFTALKYHHPHAKPLYSEYCTFSAQQRYADYDHVKKQMYKIHKPHLTSEYLDHVRYEATQDGDGRPDWVMYYVPGAKAKAEYTALNGRTPSRTTGTPRREGRREATGTPRPAAAAVLTTHAPALLQEAGDAALSSLASGARELVSHFRQGLAALPQRRPSAKDLQQAEMLLREQGEERARAIVTYALQQAPQTGFQMQHFGAVLGYQDAALAELVRQAQREQRHQEERQQRDAERQRLQQEREQEERAAAVLERLSDAQREAYRQRAREHLPALMRDMDGLVARQMHYLVIEDGLVG